MNYLDQLTKKLDDKSAAMRNADMEAQNRINDSMPDYIRSQQAVSAVRQQLQTNQVTCRPALTREDLIEVALKLNEASALITAALNRMGGR